MRKTGEVQICKTITEATKVSAAEFWQSRKVSMCPQIDGIGLLTLVTAVQACTALVLSCLQTERLTDLWRSHERGPIRGISMSPCCCQVSDLTAVTNYILYRNDWNSLQHQSISSLAAEQMTTLIASLIENNIFYLIVSRRLRFYQLASLSWPD